MHHCYRRGRMVSWFWTIVTFISFLALWTRGDNPPDIFREESLPFDICGPPEPRPMSEEQRLMRDLMVHYDPSVRPVYDAHSAVDVSLGLTLTQILDLDEKNQVLTTNVWLEASWYDERLNWSSPDYGGIGSIRIPPDRIWLPDIVLYNSVDDYTSGYMPSLAMVYNDSRVFWGPVIRFRSACNIDITFFPFDNQICKLKMGSWAYNGLQVNVWNRSSTMDLSNFVDNGEWELLAMQVKRNVVYYACCKEPFPDVTFTIVLRRRTKYYFMNIIIPCIILSFLCLGGFLLPPESGEKITLGLSVLLTITVFMLMVADKMPQTSESISVISIYLMAVLSTSCMSVLSSVLVLSIHHQRRRPKKVPPWLRWICFDLFGPIFRLQTTNPSSSQSSSNDHHDKFTPTSSHCSVGGVGGGGDGESRKSKRKPNVDQKVSSVKHKKRKRQIISQYRGKKDKKFMNNRRIGYCGHDEDGSEFASLDPKVTFANEMETLHYQVSPSDSKESNCKFYDPQYTGRNATTTTPNNSNSSSNRYQRQNINFETSSPNFSSYREVDVDTSFVVSGKATATTMTTTHVQSTCLTCHQSSVACCCNVTHYQNKVYGMGVDENLVELENSQKITDSSNSVTSTTVGSYPGHQHQGDAMGNPSNVQQQGSASVSSAPKGEGGINILEDQSLLKGMTVNQRYNVIMVTQLASLIREKQTDDVISEDIYQDWHNVAYIIDRLLFSFFLVLTIVSTACILQMRPSEVEL